MSMYLRLHLRAKGYLTLGWTSRAGNKYPSLGKGAWMRENGGGMFFCVCIERVRVGR